MDDELDRLRDQVASFENYERRVHAKAWLSTYNAALTGAIIANYCSVHKYASERADEAHGPRIP